VDRADYDLGILDEAGFSSPERGFDWELGTFVKFAGEMGAPPAE
jgi:hypothetical protein